MNFSRGKKWILTAVLKIHYLKTNFSSDKNEFGTPSLGGRQYNLKMEFLSSETEFLEIRSIFVFFLKFHFFVCRQKQVNINLKILSWKEHVLISVLCSLRRLFNFNLVSLKNGDPRAIVWSCALSIPPNPFSILTFTFILFWFAQKWRPDWESKRKRERESTKFTENDFQPRSVGVSIADFSLKIQMPLHSSYFHVALQK